MAQSHIKLTGGVGDGKRIANTISQVGHGFGVGDAIRYNRLAATGSGTDKYLKAIADSPENSEVVGVVSEVLGPDTFVLTYSGHIDTSTFNYSLANDDVFFLSDETAGTLTNTPPSTAGSVIKPVLVRMDSDNAIITNYVGTVIGGTSVVSLDGVQPVGTVEPYAGTVDDVPTTWSLCDGGGLLITEYPELYSRIGIAFGYHVKVEAETIPSGIEVGYLAELRNGDAVVATGRVAEVGSYIVVDVNHLRIDGDKYTYDGVSAFETSELNTFNVVLPTNEPQNLERYGSVISPVINTDSEITIEDVTVTRFRFRKPDLRGKFILGRGEEDEGTAITLPFTLKRGEIGGQFDAVASSGIDGVFGGGVESVSTLPPYQGLNWIIKTTSTAKAALLDNLTASFKLSDLLDVNAPELTAQSGQIIVFDAASEDGQKYRPYRLFTDYPDDASNVFQIDNTTTTNPLVKYGNASLSDAFGIDLDGLGSGSNPQFRIQGNGSNTLFVVQKDATDGARVGVGTPPSDGVNLTIGTKGLKFSTGATVNTIRTSVRGSNNASDSALVTEKAVRNAIPTWKEVDLTTDAGPFSAKFTNNTTIRNNSSSTAFVSMGIRSPISGDGRVIIYQNGTSHRIGLDGQTALATFITVPIGPGQTFRADKSQGTINSVRVTWMEY